MLKTSRKMAIRKIVVEKLFGLYDYEIPGPGEKKKIETVLLLYGENGTGKTTILTLLFHLLATESGGGT